MPAIVYQTNKKTGITYAYESLSHWDKDKKQSRAKRKCIGRIDPETKQIVPTQKRIKKAVSQTPDNKPSINQPRSFYGATYLFDAIGEKLGITSDLKKCFPQQYKQILSVAYYLILEDRNPLSRFPKWAATHKHPYGKNIASQRSSELFASISEEAREHFFRLQGKHRMEQEYWAYDITSISSYSKCLSQVKYGVNKDGEPLPQINLALLFGEKSMIPFYYRKLAGNIPDVKTIKKLLKDIDYLAYKEVKLVMDRGFYSTDNINDLYKNRLKFLISAKVGLKFIQAELDKVRNPIRDWTNYSQEYDLYACTTTIPWVYSQNRPYKKDSLNRKRRMYLHIYQNMERIVEDEKNLNKLLCCLQQELESGNWNSQHEKQYAKYFNLTATPIKGTKITANQDAIAEAKKNYGFFVLLSNEIKDPIEALEVYRNKDLVEKAFGNLKDRLNFNRTGVSSDKNLDGKLFVEFVALIYLSYIKKQMQEKKLFKKYTMQELLDELDVIECFEQEGHKLCTGEVTNKQLDLYKAMDIKLPTSLHISGM